MRSKELEDALKFDPLDFAERVTGDRSKAHDGVGTALGMLLHMDHGHYKNRLLTEAGDTTMSNKLTRYLKIITEAGFEQVLAERFDSHRDGEYDTYFVYARRDGFLLTFDSYYQSSDEVETSLNGGKLWYNWVPSPDLENRWGVISSGGMTDGVWVGDHDCREALLHNIAGLKENGTVLSPWKHRHSCFWLMSYADWNHPDYANASYHDRTPFIEATTERRIALLPDWVKEMIKP